MQKTSLLPFLITIECIFLLFSLLILPINVKTISSLNEINNLENNQKVQFQGKVISQTNTSESIRVILDNNISFRSTNKNISYLNKTIIVQGIISSFYDNKTMSVTSINIQHD
jgi:hypothetical protein